MSSAWSEILGQIEETESTFAVYLVTATQFAVQIFQTSFFLLLLLCHMVTFKDLLAEDSD